MSISPSILPTGTTSSGRSITRASRGKSVLLAERPAQGHGRPSGPGRDVELVDELAYQVDAAAALVLTTRPPAARVAHRDLDVAVAAQRRQGEVPAARRIC